MIRQSACLRNWPNPSIHLKKFKILCMIATQCRCHQLFFFFDDSNFDSPTNEHLYPIFCSLNRKMSFQRPVFSPLYFPNLPYRNACNRPRSCLLGSLSFHEMLVSPFCVGGSCLGIFPSHFSRTLRIARLSES